jgi:hypothetical protein
MTEPFERSIRWKDYFNTLDVTTTKENQNYNPNKTGVYKLSHQKVVAHGAKATDRINIFGGSSLNRQKTKDEGTKKNTVATCTEVVDLSNEPNEAAYLLLNQGVTTNDKPKKRNTKKPVRRSCLRSMSPRTKTKIRDKIFAFYQACPNADFRFLTLSFLNAVDDELSVKILNKFLTVVRKHFPECAYIWIAERQHANIKYKGNIHFHLIINCHLPIIAINALWVKQQFNAGIEFEGYSKAYINTCTDKEINKILNPADIKKIDCVDGLSHYLTAYITKNIDQFKCSVWHSSRKVSRLITSQLTSKRIFEESQDLSINCIVDYTTGELFEGKTYVTEYAIVSYICNKKHFSKYLTEMQQLNQVIMQMSAKQPYKLPTISYFENRAMYN